MDTIGDRIKLKRKELGMTQLELGKRLNVTDRAVSKWEQNNGDPDVSSLPALAKILNVTIDYLLTGEESQKEVIFKTPKEMLIETDDPTYLDKIGDKKEDQDFLTDIFEYIYEYQLINVFNFIIDSNPKGGASLFSNQWCNHHVQGRKTEHILFLCLISNRLDRLYRFEFSDIGFADIKHWNEEMINAFVNDDRVLDDTRKYVLTTHCRALKDKTGKTWPIGNGKTIHKEGNWQDMYPRFLDAFANAKKWEWVQFILNAAYEINKSACELKEKERHGCFTFSALTGFSPFRVMAVNKNTLDILLKEGQFDLLKLANTVNSLVGKETIEDKIIQLQKMKMSPNADIKKVLVFEYSSNCILDYNALLNSKTIPVNVPSEKDDVEEYLEALLKQYKDILKEIIDENPISFIELTYKCLRAKNLKELFKISIDFDIKDLTAAVIKGDYDNIATVAKNTFVYTRKDECGRNYLFGKPRVNLRLVSCSSCRYAYGLCQIENPDEIPSNVNEAIKFFKKYKENIFNKWVEDTENKITHIRVKKENEQNYVRLKNEMTSSLLYDLIEKGDVDTVIIKLCNRLESILKHKYGFSGDLKTMLDEFYKGPLEDYDIYNECCEKPSIQRALSKLRMKRNNLVHSEQNNVDFSINDLKQCISIIEEIDKL